MTTRDDKPAESSSKPDVTLGPAVASNVVAKRADAARNPRNPRKTRELPSVAPVPAADAISPGDTDDDEAPAPRAEPAPTVPRKTTLAVAIPKRPPEAGEPGRAMPAKPGAAPGHVEARERANSAFAAEAPGLVDAVDEMDDMDETDEMDVVNEVDEDDEWSIADQPTVYLTPRSRTPTPRATPPTADVAAMPQRRTLAHPGGAPRPPLTSRPAGAPGRYGRPRLDSPSGRLMSQTPPAGVSPAALPDPRLQRFQRLREQRLAHDAGDQAPDDPRSVADVARQWWNDLAPGVRRALDHQHEARASGVHPIPAYEPAPSSRLGDAFGRLAASARGLGKRAQAVAGPALKGIHAQAEQAAQALVQRIEGPAARQQAPLLGPGRIAVFFRQGVTLRQAHEALMAAHARPLRLIPRKHGFLAYVAPGSEADIAAILRDDPDVADVAYLEYDDHGNPVS